MITVEQFRDCLLAAIAAEGSQVAFANKHDVSTAYLNEMVKGKRSPSDKVLDALGYEAVTLYRKKSAA